ncbi:MAG TPA: c-type cytochrome [Candidatus Limnocylindria bacterium]|jgi:cytochrome c peroxidase|nr:c-type cytochrome [Candidatus Limnocylindria bacterium]
MTFRRLASLALAAWTSIALRLVAENPAGLVATFGGSGATDQIVADNVWLYVPAGQPATPFVPPGAFTATWRGQVAAELRADFTFHAEFNGELKLTINDTVVLEGKSEGDKPVTGQSVRLNKGANNLVAEFKSPASGDAFVRLFWSNKETPYTPLPLGVLSHAENEDLKKSLLVHRGRDLFAENRCIRCHTATGGMPELAADAPAFTGIGGRRNYDWIDRWIADPHALRAGTPMPQLFTGADAKDKAEATAAFLASLKGEAKLEVRPGDAEAGKALFEKLHCIACHNPPEGGDVDPKKIAQKQVKAKYAPGALVAFLQKPAEHYAWIRMPNFRLTADEAGSLAAYLEANADQAADRVAPTETALIEKGRGLVQTAGCLNCHALEGAKNEFAGKALADLAADKWTAGCLADQPSADGKAPHYAFTEEDRAALRAFAATDRSALTRHTAADFLGRQTERLNCRECHGKFEGFPTFELLLGKLRPEYATGFIAGTETWKPRPWLEGRMPNFTAYAEPLGTGLATIAGLPPKTAPDPAPADTADLAKIGQKLVSANGGFACISCHPVGSMGATQVFEAPGLNLAHTFGRIQPSYFRRWLRAPTSVDPTTKMPTYFDEDGKSPFPDILGGDGPKTIGAVWEYLRLGEQMPRPE